MEPIAISEAEMLEKIRALLKLTIEDFCSQMDWPNSKYYDYIKNGRKRPGEATRKDTHPTINKVFVGINQAIRNYDLWKQHSSEIMAIIVHYLMPEF